MGEFTRKPIDEKLRFYIFERDNFKCEYCGSKKGTHNNVILHVDHIIPVSKGGKNNICNLVTSCEKCNLGKGAKILVNGRYIDIKSHVTLRTLWHETVEQHQFTKCQEEHRALYNSAVITAASFLETYDFQILIEGVLEYDRFSERVLKLGGDVVDYLYKDENPVFEQ